MRMCYGRMYLNAECEAASCAARHHRRVRRAGHNWCAYCKQSRKDDIDNAHLNHHGLCLIPAGAKIASHFAGGGSGRERAQRELDLVPAWCHLDDQGGYPPVHGQQKKE